MKKIYVINPIENEKVEPMLVTKEEYEKQNMCMEKNISKFDSFEKCKIACENIELEAKKKANGFYDN